MKHLLKLCALALTVGFFAHAAPKTGSAAPDFTLTDSHGKKVGLAQSKGKWVVLEWLNHGCPFVRKHYDAGNMQALQSKYTKRGVVWYSIISSAKGKQGYSTPEQANADVAKFKAAPTAVLLDTDGIVGKQYAASTTPHLFVIDPKGVLVYQGAIDDKATTDTADIQSAKNYVSAALDAGLAGKPVSLSSTKAYGCSIKYLN